MMTTFVFSLGNTIHGDLVTPFFFWVVTEEKLCHLMEVLQNFSKSKYCPGKGFVLLSPFLLNHPQSTLYLCMNYVQFAKILTATE